MKRWILTLVGVAGVALPAWAADGVVEGGPYRSPPTVGAPAPTDQSTLELSWDNGSRRWSVGWYTGAGSWVGNDFDASTLKTSYVNILKFKMYTRSDWPNSTWDGFRLGIYGFGGGVPGSRLWPTSGGGYFYKPSSGTGHVWVVCDINWTCPSVKFLAAQEQYYNWPTCDPWSVDNNPTFLQHSWNYYGGQWGPLSSVNIAIGPYYNLMIRVLVETGISYPGIAPSSIGRVKALYY